MRKQSQIGLHFVLVALIALSIGYVAGRGHTMYRMRSSRSAAMQYPQDPVPDGGTNPVARDDAPQQSIGNEEIPPRKIKQPEALKATLLQKGFHEHDLQKSEIQDLIIFSVSFENIEGKDIKAFEGVLVFRDLLDNYILSCSVAVTRPVAAGQTIEWNGQLNYIPFLDSHKKLRNESKANIKAIFVPIKVIFADGTTRQFE